MYEYKDDKQGYKIETTKYKDSDRKTINLNDLVNDEHPAMYCYTDHLSRTGSRLTARAKTCVLVGKGDRKAKVFVEYLDIVPREARRRGKTPKLEEDMDKVSVWGGE